MLFDAGNTLLFLDHERMAAAVGTALGLPITAAALDRSTAAATRAVEGAPGVAAGRTDRERARTYLEALFTGGGTRVPAPEGPAVAPAARPRGWPELDDGRRRELARRTLARAPARVLDAVVALLADPAPGRLLPYLPASSRKRGPLDDGALRV